jgi:hypothetical protein
MLNILKDKPFVKFSITILGADCFLCHLIFIIQYLHYLTDIIGHHEATENITC